MRLSHRKLKLVHVDTRPPRRRLEASCMFCWANIYSDETYYQGGTKYGYAYYTFCSKCAAEKGVIW